MSTVATEGRGSWGEGDIRGLFSFNRLGKGGHYGSNPGNASVKVWVRLRGWLFVQIQASSQVEGEKLEHLTAEVVAFQSAKSEI